jgi:hypothetical protein
LVISTGKVQLAPAAILRHGLAAPFATVILVPVVLPISPGAGMLYNKSLALTFEVFVIVKYAVIAMLAGYWLGAVNLRDKLATSPFGGQLPCPQADRARAVTPAAAKYFNFRKFILEAFY